MQNWNSLTQNFSSFSIFFSILIHNECWNQFYLVMSLLIKPHAIAFCSYFVIFILFLSLTLHAEHVTPIGKGDAVFSIPVHVFGDLFWKICFLFGQILMTCLKCSRTSFLPFSYCEKLCWGRGLGRKKLNNGQWWQHFWLCINLLLQSSYFKNTLDRAFSYSNCSEKWWNISEKLSRTKLENIKAFNNGPLMINWNDIKSCDDLNGNHKQFLNIFNSIPYIYFQKVLIRLKPKHIQSPCLTKGTTTKMKQKFFQKCQKHWT